MMREGGVWKTETARALAVGAGYGLLAFASLSITRFGTPVESIWVSNALLVWALANARLAAWPLLMACAAVGHVSAHLLTSDNLPITLAFLVGDMAECAIAGYLLWRRPRALAFEDRFATLYFVLICGLVAPLASSAVAFFATAVATGQGLGFKDLAVWYSADALGLLVFLPILHSVSSGRWKVLAQKPVMTIATTAITVLITSVALTYPEGPLFRVLFLPVFVLMAFELGVAGVQLGLGAVLLVWLLVVWQGFTLPVWSNLDQRDNLLMIQAFAAIFAATLLPLAATLAQKQRLADTLADTLKDTQEAWGAIIGAEARYRLVVDNVSETVMRVVPGGQIVFASPACTALLHADRAFEGRNFLDLLHPDDRAWVIERVRQSLDQNLYNLAQRWKLRMHGDDDTWHPIIARVTPLLLGPRGEHEFLVVLRPEQDDAAASSERELGAQGQSVE
jgi:integral membrane sensor domain MASE1